MLTSTTDDYFLVKNCLEGNQRAYKSIFDRYSKKMMALCCRYADHLQEGEDWMQDGFIRAFDKLHLFRGTGTFEAWLRKIMVNVCLKRIAGKNKLGKKVFLQDELDIACEPKVLENLDAQDIVQIINTLPTGYRTIFNLYVIDGYSHKEIAALLSIQTASSRSQLSKAKKLLQKKLINHYAIAV